VNERDDRNCSAFSLPVHVERACVPPVKCQGIKTKLVPFLARSIAWHGEGRWVEPFAGSGVVAFSIAPPRAILAESNPHIVRLYRGIQSGQITAMRVRGFLQREGAKLAVGGAEYYYEVRSRFNRNRDPLDFLFLNRSCFNGLIRFNKSGLFNVPFGHKPNRFAPAYITKIVNQVDRVSGLLKRTGWEVREADWRETLNDVSPGDFVYADPPYIARFTDYYNQWEDGATNDLLEHLDRISCGYALSTWSHNKYRRNVLLDMAPRGCSVVTEAHFYHLGATETLRNAVEEALIIRSDHAVCGSCAGEC